MIEAAIVLAAGRGARMGGPKALLVIDGEALVVRHVLRLRELGCPRVIVAVPTALAAQVRELLGDRAETLALDTRQQAETLAAALAALESAQPLRATDRVLITPIDLRPCGLETLRRLAEAEAEAACPRYQGKNGHPLVVRRRVLAPYLGAAPPPLDALIAPLRVFVPTEDPATIEDFDEPSDLPPPRA